MEPSDRNLIDVVGMLTVVADFRRTSNGPVDLACQEAGDELAEILARHMPDGADQAVAGTAMLLAASFIAALHNQHVPTEATGIAMAVAGARLVEGLDPTPKDQ